jgi:hypothetical protein
MQRWETVTAEVGIETHVVQRVTIRSHSSLRRPPQDTQAAPYTAGGQPMNRTTRSRLRLVSVLLAAAASAGLPTGADVAAAADDGTPQRASVPSCTSAQVVANSARRIGGTQIGITVVNKGSKPCALTGFPTVALAGLGSPDKNKPLNVIRQGSSAPVQLAVGGRASTQLTFTPVLGEADGYCASGATPFVAPSIVVGVAGGKQQLAPDDGGDFALCGQSIRATAFRAAGA